MSVGLRDALNDLIESNTPFTVHKINARIICDLFQDSEGFSE